MAKQYAWFELEDGRKVYRPIPDPDKGTSHARSNLACPHIRSDRIDPIRGYDGKIHESLSSFRKTLSPSGNPYGERFLEVGDQEVKFEKPKFDRAKRRDDIKAAIEDVKYGRVPPSVELSD